MGERPCLIMRSWTMDLNSSATWNHKKKCRFYKTNHPMFTNHPIATTHRMYSHVKGTIPISFLLIKHVVMDTHDTIPIVMTIGNPTTMVFAFTTVPPNLGVESFRPSKRFFEDNKEICSTIYLSS
jgi:hypothetical protein